MLLSPHHPLRRFQIDPDFRKKVGYIRLKLEEARKAKPKGTGFSVPRLDYDIPLGEIQSFQELQGYNQNYIATFEEINMFLRFWDGERQMFSFEPTLAADLSRTDIGEIPWEAVKLPYDCFFVSFGPILDCEKVFHDRRYKVDGFYLHRFQESAIPQYADRECLRVTITTRLIHPTYDEAKLEMPSYMSLTDPTYNFVLVGKAGDTMDEIFRNSIEANRVLERGRDECNFQESKVLADYLELDNEPEFPGSFFLNRFERGLDLIEESLPLIFNLVLYLGHGPAQPNPEFPEGAPKRLIEALQKTPSEKRRKRVREDLERLGYSKIRFIRDPQKKEPCVPFGSGVEVRPHWRRGHWRMQPYGPKLSLLKLLWVRPTMVHRDRTEGINMGRLYDVDESQ